MPPGWLLPCGLYAAARTVLAGAPQQEDHVSSAVPRQRCDSVGGRCRPSVLRRGDRLSQRLTHGGRPCSIIPTFIAWSPPAGFLPITSNGFIRVTPFSQPRSSARCFAESSSTV